MLGTIARSLGVAADLPDPIDVFAGQLAGANALVLIDNCEHVLDSLAPPITRLLASLAALAGLRIFCIQYLPARAHEGAVSAPPDDSCARIIMDGHSSVSGQRFNIAVAFERSERGGHAIAHSSFHHFADCNWIPQPAAHPSQASLPAMP